MSWLATVAEYAAPAFLVLSPIFSYGDQCVSMARKRSSAGFSLDIPLIMLVASLLRIFYYPGAHFAGALLIQAVLMVAVQLVLLKIALDHRPPPSAKGGDAAVPFAGLEPGSVGSSGGLFETRPYNFWQWRSPKPYWQFLLYLFIALTAFELTLAPFPDTYEVYSSLIGIVGLSVEATLPLPQILANYRRRSCQGFRPSVLVSWLAGDTMKMYWFYTSKTNIPFAFKMCGFFQAACDIILGIQYFVYGNGPSADTIKDKDAYRMAAAPWSTPFGFKAGQDGVAATLTLSAPAANSRLSSNSGHATPTGRITPVSEKEK